MPKAGWCDVDNAWVWVNDDGSCVNGHGPEHLTRVYDTDTQSAPLPEPVAPQPPVYAPPPQPGYPAAPPVPPGQYGYPQYQQPARDNKPVIALVLGIGSILCCFPIVTIPMGIAGLILGIKALSGPQRGLAIAAIVLSVVGIIASIINAVLGAVLNLSDPSFMNNLQNLQNLQ